MTNERIAATAAASELAFLVFLLVPQAAELGLALSVLAWMGSSVVVGIVASLVVHHFSQDDPWHEVGLDPSWDMSLDEITA